MTSKWTIALSVSTAVGTSIRDFNQQAIESIRHFLSTNHVPSTDVSFAVQNIVARHADNLCKIEYSVGDTVVETKNPVYLGDGQYLRDFVNFVKQRTEAQRILLWSITHGRTTRQEVTVSGIPVEIEPTNPHLDVVTSSPTDHPKPPVGLDPALLSAIKFRPSKRLQTPVLQPQLGPVGTGVGLGAGLGVGAGGEAGVGGIPHFNGAIKPASLDLIWPSAVQVNSHEYGAALAALVPELAIVFLQSCCAGGFDLVERFSANSSCEFTVLSPTMLPVPKTDYLVWIDNLRQAPDAPTNSIAKSIANAVVDHADTTVSAEEWPPVPYARALVCSVNKLTDFVQAFKQLLEGVAVGVSSSPQESRALKNWLESNDNRPESTMKRVAMNELLAYLTDHSVPLGIDTTLSVAAHDALIEYERTTTGYRRYTLTIPSQPPKTPPANDVFDQTGWNGLLRTLSISP